MTDFETTVKDYSSQKLKEIIEQQSDSYSQEFIDCAKDELIKRGEPFRFDAALEQQILSMDDAELKKLVEEDWENYHLECMEIARKEYLRRNFKFDRNKVSEKPDMEEAPEDAQQPATSKYPALLITSGLLTVVGVLYGICGVVLGIYFFSKQSTSDDTVIGAAAFIGGLLGALFLIATSESIKVIVDIEANTRNGK